MTKRRENRGGRNQVVWDQARHWGKKKKNRRGRKRKKSASEASGEAGLGKGRGGDISYHAAWLSCG